MRLATTLIRLFNDDRGAVTVDWVVLTASVVIIGVGSIFALGDGLSDLVNEVNSELTFENITTQSN